MLPAAAGSSELLHELPGTASNKTQASCHLTQMHPARRTSHHTLPPKSSQATAPAATVEGYGHEASKGASRGSKENF